MTHRFLGRVTPGSSLWLTKARPPALSMVSWLPGHASGEGSQQQWLFLGAALQEERKEELGTERERRKGVSKLCCKLLAPHVLIDSPFVQCYVTGPLPVPMSSELPKNASPLPMLPHVCTQRPALLCSGHPTLPRGLPRPPCLHVAAAQHLSAPVMHVLSFLLLLVIRGFPLPLI